VIRHVVAQVDLIVRAFQAVTPEPHRWYYPSDPRPCTCPACERHRAGRA
jgi:hypothetical protein